MNIVKVQTDYLKRLISGKQTLFCSGVDGKVGLSDASAVYLIPDKQLFLDRKGNSFFDLEKHHLLEAFLYSVLAEQTDEVLETNDGVAVKFQNENTFVFVLKKYLAYFDKYDRFYAKGPRDPLYVTDEDMQLQAIILPRNVNVSKSN